MELTKFEFPEITAADMMFPTMKADSTLLQEAKERGFYNGDTPYNKLFSDLFFKGGGIKFKPGLDPSFKAKAWPYLRSFMGSWEPKHEEKEAICAMLLSELVESGLIAD